MAKLKNLPKDVMLPQDKARKTKKDTDARGNVRTIPTEAEIDAAIKLPRYRFEERVQKMMAKGNSRADAEQLVRTCIAIKELPDDRPHIYFTSDGRAFFACGEIAAQVDTRDLNKVLGTCGETGILDKLMDSQWAQIAAEFGLPIDPFSRELLLRPLRGYIQRVWYRDVEGHEISDTTAANQAKCVADYITQLKTWKPAIDENAPRGAHRGRVSSSSSLMSKTFQVTGKDANVARGRESDLLSVFGKKPMTFAQVVAAAKDKVKTRQDFETIVARFLRELVEHGAVQEVK